MNWTLSLLSVGLFLSSFFVLGRGIPLEPSVGVAGDGLHADGTADTSNGFIQNGGANEEEEYSDFEDDDSEGGLINLVDSGNANVGSVTNLRKEGGEVLVPCFGMWWPVGGGATYDYVDYYGDYKKKRRRSKRKKSAKMKKKKS